MWVCNVHCQHVPNVARLWWIKVLVKDLSQKLSIVVHIELENQEYVEKELQLRWRKKR